MLSFADVKNRKNKVLELANMHGVSNIRVFGSIVRGDANNDSDLDLLVSLDKGRSLLDRIAFMQDLEDLFKIRVDVVNENALDSSIRNNIENERFIYHLSGMVIG